MGRQNDDSFEELQRNKRRKLQSADERMKEFNNPAKSTHQTGKGRKARRKKRSFAKNLGMVLFSLQAILTVIFLWVIFSLNILPMKFTVLLLIVLLALLGVVFYTQKRHKGKASYGKSLSILMIIILAAGSYYLGMINGAFNKVIGGTHKIDNMVVAVLKDDPAETIQDAKDYTFGVQYQLGAEDVRQTIDEINKEVNSEINVTEYVDVAEQAEALFEGSVKAIIYNEGYAGILEEEIANYQSEVKIIYSHEITKELLNSSVENINVKNTTFNVYLSGIDVYGSIKRTSRSDVNIIATVNTETHQILLTTTPRDYYVTIPDVSKGKRDKLTHAGIYGVDASIATLENLYETEIPFYARVNFTSIIDIVDELGGVDVNSKYSFKTIDGMKVKKGMNHFNGKQALAFSRERKNVPGGDYQRGKNQQAVIVAIIQKMISPKILVSASGIIDSVSGSVETNMSQNQLQDLIKSQLNKGGSWNIYSVAAEGKGKSDYTYSMPGRKLYVSEPVQESVQNIIDLMKRVQNGEIIEGSEVAQ